MSITREDVVDLQRGDVVELTFASGSVIRGPLTECRHGGGLSIADVGWTLRDEDGDLGYGLGRYAVTLTVVSRAPRPLYVNHPRAKPVAGDVVRDADSDDARTWTRNAPGFSYEWLCSRSHNYVPREKLPARLRLLVDGETGQVVP